ncbi:MAG TPA: SocA family protein [Methylorubrum populi]|uniref:SocA family protein n=1 Tax=Methylorubrum populi TaxID=223967 RepID=A0A921DZ33_9HYPH|nr:SocA family protein [Methylorubrum populi]
MDKLEAAIAYLCENYPHKSELSKARLTKLVYLADWKSCIENDKQISNIEWVFNHYGPYVDDIYNTAISSPSFNVERSTNFYGNRKEIISLKLTILNNHLSASEKRILDHVIEETKRLNWDQFIQLVYSTYPVLTGTRGEKLDLAAIARAYDEAEDED